MTTFALGSTELKAAERKKPDVEKTLRMLRQYQAAEAKLDQECRARGIPKPKLMAD